MCPFQVSMCSCFTPMLPKCHLVEYHMQALLHYKLLHVAKIRSSYAQHIARGNPSQRARWREQAYGLHVRLWIANPNLRLSGKRASKNHCKCVAFPRAVCTYTLRQNPEIVFQWICDAAQSIFTMAVDALFGARLQYPSSEEWGRSHRGGSYRGRKRARRERRRSPYTSPAGTQVPATDNATKKLVTQRWWHSPRPTTE